VTFNEYKPSLLRRFVRFLWGYDFFVSYQWASGGTYAVSLAERLRDRGYDCFLDRAEFAAGDDWRTEAQQALRHTNRLVIIATRDAIAHSQPVRHELEVFTNRSNRVIPIVFGKRFSDEERRAFPTLALVPPVTVDVIEDHSRLEVGPSNQAIDELIQAHRLLKRRTLRSSITATALIVLAVAATTATVFWRTAERQRTIAEEAFLESQHTLGLNSMQRGINEIRDTGEGPGLRSLLRAYEIAKRVDQPLEEQIPEDRGLSLSARRLMAGWASVVGLSLVHEEQVVASTLGSSGRIVRTKTVNYDGEPSSFQFWDATTGARIGDGLYVDDAHFDISMDAQWTTALHWSGTGFSHRDIATGSSRAVTSAALRVLSEDYRQAYSNTAQRLAAIQSESTIQLWSTETAEVVNEIDVGFADIGRLEFAHDGSVLLVVDRGNTVFALLDVANGRLRGQPVRSDTSFRRLVLSPNGQSVVVVDERNAAELWTLSNDQIAQVWSMMAMNAPLVRFSPNGEVVLVADEHVAHLISADNGRSRIERLAQVGAVELGVFSLDNRLLATVDASRVRPGAGNQTSVVYIWDANTGLKRQSIQAPPGRVTGIVFAADGTTVAVASDSAIELFDVVSGRRRGGPWARTKGSSAPSFADGGRILRWLDRHSRLVRVFEAAVPSRLLALPDGFTEARLSADGMLLVAIGRNRMQLYRFDSGQPVGTPAPITDLTFDVEVRTDDKVVAEVDGALRSWVISPTGISTPVDTPKPVDGTITVMPGGEVVSNGRKSDHVWSSDSGWIEISWPDGVSEVALLTHSAGGMLTAAGGYDAQLWLLNQGGGEMWQTIDTGSGTVQDIEEPESLSRILFTPDATGVFTATTYGALQLWDVNSGQLVRAFGDPRDEIGPAAPSIGAAAFSSDGSILATGHGERVRLWDVSTGNLIVELLGHDRFSDVSELVFVESDRMLLSAAGDAVYRWSTPELRDDIESIRRWIAVRDSAERALTRVGARR